MTSATDASVSPPVGSSFATVCPHVPTPPVATLTYTISPNRNAFAYRQRDDSVSNAGR
jgi:hypothetical protein